MVLTALLADGYLRREAMDGPSSTSRLLLPASVGVVMAVANGLIVVFLLVVALLSAIKKAGGAVKVDASEACTTQSAPQATDHLPRRGEPARSATTTVAGHHRAPEV